MKKKRAILNFAGIIFVSLILVVLSVIKFPIPGTSDEYVGFIRAIDLSLEYQGGTQLTFAVKNNEANTVNVASGVEAHVLRIKNVLNSNSYDAEVYSVGGANIIVELKNEYDGEEVADLINTYNELTFRSEENTTGKVYLTSDDIKTVYGMQNPEYTGASNQSAYGVYIEFTSEGRQKFKDLTSEITSDGSSQGIAYIYIGDFLFQSIKLSNVIDQDYLFIREIIDQDDVSINGRTNLNTQEDADLYAAQMNASKYNFAFEQISKNVITEEVATRNIIVSTVLTFVIVLVCLIVLIVKFKKAGLVSAFALFICLLLQIIMLQAIPVVKLTSPALVGSLITFVIGFVISYYMLKTMANEYAQGKNLHSSIKFGYLKTYKTGVEICLAIIVAAIMFIIFGSTLIRYFALSVVVGTIIYGLTTLLLNRWFINLYHNINPSRPKNYGFNREANVDELEQI